MSDKQPKLKFKEDQERAATRSPPKKGGIRQDTPKKKKLKLDADKAAEKAQHLRFGKAEITPDEASRMSKAQKREMYAATIARSAAHREVDQYENDNVGTQALNEGLKTEETATDFAQNRYARKLKKKAKLQAKKKSSIENASAHGLDKAQNTGESSVIQSDSSKDCSNWLSRWKQRQEIRKNYYAASRSGGTASRAAQSASSVSGSKKTASNGVTAAKSGAEQVVEKGKSVVSTAVNGIANFANGNFEIPPDDEPDADENPDEQDTN